MPLTALQKEVLQLLAKHRNPESHAGGGAVINRALDSPRYSSDLDFFHDIAGSLVTSAETDVQVLQSHGFAVEWLLRLEFLLRARIVRNVDELRLDWCFDSAFRFFPVQADPEFGYCLHPADLATNKLLAVVGRAVIRDFVDILYLHDTYLSLGAMAWAASGKDPGLTPFSILDFAQRQMKFREEDLQGEKLNKPTTLVELKTKWLQALEQARDLVAHWPARDSGCLYLNEQGVPFTPNAADPSFDKITRHFGSVRGAWPKVVS
ncbi:MAG: nucleotidyl transferase AbiEii/AbiGii toxin family protein [Gemmataceae bacterium]|nr:nucleotidyl transferase AbiEii/AbiGii toxin family protein [Gemmataceae bacterium]